MAINGSGNRFKSYYGIVGSAVKQFGLGEPLPNVRDAVLITSVRLVKILPLACLLADRPVPRIAGLADRRRRTMSIIDSWYCPQCGSHNIVGGIATECWQCSTPRPGISAVAYRTPACDKHL